MVKSLRKPSSRRQANLKERIKARNKQWTGLGKAYEPSSTSANGRTSSSVRLKSVQANNRALALALQEEKLKVREAQDACQRLKGEKQCLKSQIFYLQTLLQSQQVQAPAENVGMFPSVPVTIPVVAEQERSVEVPEHIEELEEIPGGEMKATTDSKPAGFVSEDHCEFVSADAIKEVEPECGNSFLMEEGDQPSYPEGLTQKVYLSPVRKLGSVDEDSDDGLHMPHHHKSPSKSSSVTRMGARLGPKRCLVKPEQELQNEKEVEHPTP